MYDDELLTEFFNEDIRRERKWLTKWSIAITLIVLVVVLSIKAVHAQQPYMVGEVYSDHLPLCLTETRALTHAHVWRDEGFEEFKAGFNADPHCHYYPLRFKIARIVEAMRVRAGDTPETLTVFEINDPDGDKPPLYMLTTSPLVAGEAV